MDLPVSGSAVFVMSLALLLSMWSMQNAPAPSAFASVYWMDKKCFFVLLNKNKGEIRTLGVPGLGSLFVKQALYLVVWDRYDVLALCILEFHRLFLFVENEVTFYRFGVFFLTFHLRGHVLYFVELDFRRTRNYR